MNPQLQSAIIAASTVAIGWIATYVLGKRKETELKRVERAARHVERQIEEFYGPLFNLVHQVVLANHAQHSILNPDGRAGPLSRDDADKVRDYFQKTYFRPLHEEINGVLRDKLYLVEGTVMQDVFYRYLRHATQERSQWTLWSEYRVDTAYLKGLPYPNELYEAIKADLDTLMIRYEQYSRALNTAAGVRGLSVPEQGRTAFARDLADSSLPR